MHNFLHDHVTKYRIKGILNGHGDIKDFDHNKICSILRNKHVPIDNILHFVHK